MHRKNNLENTFAPSSEITDLFPDYKNNYSLYDDFPPLENSDLAQNFNSTDAQREPDSESTIHPQHVTQKKSVDIQEDARLAIKNPDVSSRKTKAIEILSVQPLKKSRIEQKNALQTSSPYSTYDQPTQSRSQTGSFVFSSSQSFFQMSPKFVAQPVTHSFGFSYLTNTSLSSAEKVLIHNFIDLWGTKDIEKIQENITKELRYAIYSLNKNQAEDLLIYLLKDDLVEIFNIASPEKYGIDKNGVKTTTNSSERNFHFPPHLFKKFKILTNVFCYKSSDHKLSNLMGIVYIRDETISFNREIYKEFYDKNKSTVLSPSTSGIKTVQTM